MTASMLAIVLAAAACGVDSDVVETCDPAGPQTVTWSSFARGFTLARCDGCHAQASPDRRGAPEDVTFDTERDARAVGGRIRSAVIETHAMPPGGGVSEQDLALVDAWLRCD